ncbi:MAG: hypothetical protein QXM89_05000 [Candidatus Bathyarchaeia archaeon]
MATVLITFKIPLNRVLALIGLGITAIGVTAALATLSPELLNTLIPILLITIGGILAASYRINEDWGFYMLLWGSMIAVLGVFWAIAQYYPTYVNTLAFFYIALIGLAVFLTGLKS